MKKLTTSSLMIFFLVVGMTKISSAIPVSAGSFADSVFLSPGYQWSEHVMFGNTDSVYTQEGYPMLDLCGIFNHDKSIIQTGDNEVYTLLYHDLSLPGTSGSVWRRLNSDTSYYGLSIFPNPYENMGDYSPNTLDNKDRVGFVDRSLDSQQDFLASEIQVDGAKVPEPATVLLFGIGLTGLSRIRSRGNLFQ